jgi:hypothetical protein
LKNKVYVFKDNHVADIINLLDDTNKSIDLVNGTIFIEMENKFRNFDPYSIADAILNALFADLGDLRSELQN